MLFNSRTTGFLQASDYNGSDISYFLSSRGLWGSTAGFDINLRKYWLPDESNPSVARWSNETEWFAQFTAGSGRNYYDSTGELRAGAATNVMRFDYVGSRRRLVNDGAATNLLTCRKHNPTDTTNWSLTGDASATLSVVDATSDLIAGKLYNVCTNGLVYKLDNSAGVSSADAVSSATSPSGSSYWFEAYVWGGTGRLTSSPTNAGVVNFSANAVPTRVGVGMIGLTTATSAAIRADAGQIVYFILPGLYNRRTPVYAPISGDTLTTSAQAAESFRLPSAVETLGAGSAISLMIQCQLFYLTVGSCLYSFGSGTETNRWQSYMSNGRSYLTSSVEGVNIVNFNLATSSLITANQEFGVATTVSSADYAQAVSRGVLNSSTSAGSLPVVTRGYLGRRQDSGAAAVGLFSAFACWPTRVPNARLSQLAAPYSG